MISFDAIRRLPLILPAIKDLTDEKCYEFDFAGAHVIVTHKYQVVYGSVFDASIFGSPDGEEMVVEAISAEFGPVIASTGLETGITHYLWASGSPHIPETDVHKHVTETEIRRICNKHELSMEDVRILHDLIAHRLTLFDQPDKLDIYIASQIGRLTKGRRQNILQAIAEISTLYAE